MGSVNLDNTGSGSAITLSSDGTSLLLDGTAVGGGADLYAVETTGSTDPTASGTLSLAIGSGASATGLRSVAVGRAATATAQDSVAIGTDADTGSATGSVAIKGDISGPSSNASVSILGATTKQGVVQIGLNGYVQANNAVAIGYDADVESSGTAGVAIGATAHVNGAYAVALGNSRANGASSFSAVIDNNTSSYGATGANSIAMGYQAKARDTRAIAIGYSTDVFGYGGVAIGSNCYVNQGYGVAMGNYARTHARYGAFIYANGYFADAGDAQTGIMVLRKSTTEDTPSALTSTGGAAASFNQLVLTNESAITFTGTVVCREDATDGDDYAGWEIKGVIMRQGQASDTTLGVGIVNSLYHTAGLANASVALSADTTNGTLQVEATGIAATNLHWVATLNFSEVKNF